MAITGVGRAIMRRIGRSPLVFITAVLIGSATGAQEKGVAPPVVLEGRVEIPAKFDGGATIRLLELGMEALGMELRGRVELSSVTPPAGRFVVDSLVGDPQRMIAFISGWLPLPEGLTWHAGIDSIRFEDLVLSFGAKPLSMTIARLSWRDAEMGPLVVTTGREGEWSVDARQASSGLMPIVFSGIPELTGLRATGLHLQGRPGELSLRVDRLELQGSAIENLALERREAPQDKNTGVWQAAASSARIDLERLWPWMVQWSDVAAWQRRIREAWELETTQVRGELSLSSLELSGRQTSGDGGAWVVDGARADILANGVAFSARRRDDGKKFLWPTISEAKARLRLQPERLELGPISLSAADSGGGGLKLDAHLFWPPDLQRMRLDLASHDMSWAGYRVDGELGWQVGAQTPIDLKVCGPDGLGLVLRGRAQLWEDQDEPGVDLILREVAVDLPVRSQGAEAGSKKRRQNVSDRSLLPSGPVRPPFPFRIQADRVSIAHWPPLSQLTLQSLSSEGSGARDREPVILGFRGQWCDIDLGGEMAADRQGEIAVQLEARIRDVAFSSLVACALALSGRQTPPIYIEGRTSGRLLAGAHGHTSAQMVDSTMADLSLTLRQGRIMRLSNIDASLGVVLDILSLAGLNPTQLRDTLPLDSLTLRLRQRGKVMEVRPIAFRSPLLTVDGALRSDLGTERPVVDLDMHVKAKGISKHLRKRINLESKADAQDKPS